MYPPNHVLADLKAECLLRSKLLRSLQGSGSQYPQHARTQEHKLRKGRTEPLLFISQSSEKSATLLGAQ